LTRFIGLDGNTLEALPISESDILLRVALSNPATKVWQVLLGPCFSWEIAPTVNHVVVAAEDAREHEDVKVEYV